MENLRDLLEELERYGTVKELEAGEQFIEQGQVPGKIGIVKKGLFRYYYLAKNGKEFTKVFMAEGSVLSSYSAMIMQSPSHFNIECLEQSVVVEVLYRTWCELRSQSNKWDKLLIDFLERGYGAKEKREREFLLMDAESRYKEFLRSSPTLVTRVKQHMIASYLGITPIALSRVRKKMDPINLG